MSELSLHIHAITNLIFHDLTDREPLKYTITVRNGYNPSRLQEDGFQVYTVKKDLHEIGITTQMQKEHRICPRIR